MSYIFYGSPMLKNANKHFNEQKECLIEQGLYKVERLIQTQQSTEVRLSPNNANVINFCANNYLGLANHPKLLEAAKKAIDQYGYGMASVRFICGTQTPHKALEEKLSDYLGTEDCILFPSCFDANGGLFEALFDAQDAIISDSLNHASLIDGIRLCKAKRYRFSHNSIEDLELKLKEADQFNPRFKVIVTDGVFSMDGTIANLKSICDLADQYQALVVIDDCHATGFLGKSGRGTHEYCDVMGRIDIITGTLGKALGGASGGYIASSKPIIDWLRQRARPYLFSNTLAPMITATSLEVFNILEHEGDALREKLFENTLIFRKSMEESNFQIKPGNHPIVPIMLFDEKHAQLMSQKLIDDGIYVVGFSYPVVPKGQARIRVQLCATHSKKQIQTTIEKFQKIQKSLSTSVNT
jgi:glycine C-acetyltransferase